MLKSAIIPIIIAVSVLVGVLGAIDHYSYTSGGSPVGYFFSMPVTHCSQADFSKYPSTCGRQGSGPLCNNDDGIHCVDTGGERWVACGDVFFVLGSGVESGDCNSGMIERSCIAGREEAVSTAEDICFSLGCGIPEIEDNLGSWNCVDPPTAGCIWTIQAHCGQAY